WNRIARADRSAHEELQDLPEGAGQNRQAQEAAGIGRVRRKAARQHRGDHEVDRLDRRVLQREAGGGERRRRVVEPVDDARGARRTTVEIAREKSHAEYARRHPPPATTAFLRTADVLWPAALAVYTSRHVCLIAYTPLSND